MIKIQNSKPYKLEERTYLFARECRNFVKLLPKCTANFEYGKQLIRSSGSVAANYIEANEALSKKSFRYRINICRKEAKESRLWLKLSEVRADKEEDKNQLVNEAYELTKIFASIVEKSR